MSKVPDIQRVTQNSLVIMTEVTSSQIFKNLVENITQISWSEYCK